MKVARLYKFGDIRIEEEPIPTIGEGDALIKTKASGICSGDVMPWYIEKKAPLVLGHEPVGEVVEVGAKVRSYKPGQRIFVHHHAPCFLCDRCRRGDYMQCDVWKASHLDPGGISEYIRVPALNLENDSMELRDSVSYESATLVEPLACVIRGLKRSRVRNGDTALVMGLGVMGMLHIMSLRKYGATSLIGADRVPFRLEHAKTLGADHVIDISQTPLPEAVTEYTKGLMANLVVVGPNSVEAITEGIKCLAPGGTLLMFTPVKPGEKITLELNDLYFKGINIITSYSCGPNDTADAMEYIEDGAIKAEHIVTHRFGIDDTMEAYRLTAMAQDSLKCLIVFE